MQLEKVRYLLTICLFWLILLISGLAVENVAIMHNSDIRSGFSLEMIAWMGIIFLALVVFYFILEHKKNHLSFNYLIALALLLFTVTNIIIILAQPLSSIIVSKKNDFPIEVVFTWSDKWIYVIQLAMSMVVAYLILVPYTRNSLSLRLKYYVYWIVVIVNFVTIIYSVIQEFDIYKTIFTGGDITTVRSAKSFYPNANFYGTSLMIGTMSLMVLQIYQARVYKTVTIFIFMIAETFTGCGSTLAISGSLLIIYLIYNIIYDFRRRPSVAIIKFFALLTVIALFVGLYFFANLNESIWFRSYHDFISERYLSGDKYGLNSFKSRIPVWEAAIEQIFSNPLGATFGYGYKTGSEYFRAVLSSSRGAPLGEYDVLTAHNALLEVIIRHGIIGGTIYLGIIIIGLVDIIYLLFKKRARFALIFGFCYLGLLAHGLVESSIFFEGNVKGMVMTVLFLSPILAEAHKLRHPEEIKEYKEEAKKLHNMDLQSKVRSLTSFLASFFAVSVLLLVFNKQYFNFALLIFISLAFVIILPIVYAIFRDKSTFKMFKMHSLLLLGIILTIVGLSFILLRNSELIIRIIFASFSSFFALLAYAIPLTVHKDLKASSYLKWLLKGLFLDNWFAHLFTLIFGIIVITILNLTGTNSLFIELLFYLSFVVIHYTVYLLSNELSESEISKKLNEQLLLVSIEKM